ncbi:MAG TPA: zinc ribbon domain-containing protein [Candidatus Thermoplasmatota archaeon]|nr:zinc ribbon domain-containing protein [Candidatus Thermoplasmatota archaeon]
MRTCPSCGREYPEVAGAPTQVCPHCGFELAAAPAGAAVVVGTDPVGAIRHAWRLARGHYLSFLVLWLPALALELAGDTLTDAYSRARGFTEPMTTGEQMQLLGVALPLFLLLSIVQLALWTFVAARVLALTPMPAPRVSWRALLPAALLGGLVLTLTYTAGLLLLLVGFFVFLHWFLYVPAEIARGARGVGAAFEASRRFARERRTHGFTALVVLVGALAFVPYVALDGLPGWQGNALSALWAWLTGPVVPLLAASYVAIAQKGDPTTQRSVVPATRATTTCPRCATLIPYTPGASGGAVDVTCPSCGYAGRVL